MGALISALRATPVNSPVTLYTDSLSSLSIIRRWLRRDFGFCLDEEGHVDLVLHLVRELHRRKAVQTTFVWVQSHTGEPGNEVADILAKEGVDGKRPIMDRECTDIEFWSPTRGLVNFLGWRAATTRWANRNAWQHTATYLQNTSKAASTQSLLRADRSRATLGKVLQNRKRLLTERAVRRMLQARGFNTPVQAVLSRNSGGTVTATCPFCHQEPETLGHFQMTCTHFHDARCVAHNTVANATIEAVHGVMKKQMPPEQRADIDQHPALWLDTPMHDLYPSLRGAHEGTFRPDGIVLDHYNQRIHVLELTRGMDANAKGWAAKEDAKVAAYHATTIYLQEQHPGYEVIQTNFIVGVLGSVVYSEWLGRLAALGFSAAEVQRVIETTVSNAVAAFDATLSVRQAAREALGGDEAGFSPHPSQRDRPPAQSRGLAAR